MTETTDDSGATPATGTTGGGAGLPGVDPDLQARVWAILNAAVARGEMPPSARAIRTMVNRNNSVVLRAVSAWHEERRVLHQATAAVGVPVVTMPTVSDVDPPENTLVGIPPAVAAVLHTANEALSAGAQALAQVVSAVRDALAEADERAERRLGEALAAANAAAEATLAAERERFMAERALLQDTADARMAESARMVEDAAGMMEELEAREAGTLVRVAALEARIDAAVAEAAAQQVCIDALRKDLADTRDERDAAQGEAATLADHLESKSKALAVAEARFDSLETERRSEIDHLRAEKEQGRADLADAHRQIIALAAQASAAGSLGALVERLLATMPIPLAGNVAAAPATDVSTNVVPAAAVEPDASGGADDSATGCPAEAATAGKGGAAVPARPKAGPVRRPSGAAEVKEQQARLPFGANLGDIGLHADGTTDAADITAPPVAADGAATPMGS